MRLLLIEDDAQLAQWLRSDLESAGYAVDISSDGIEAQFLGEESGYDGAILDLGLPGKSGLEVLRHWRAHGNDLPVIILTARDAWHEKVDGFKAGADDYVSKPFHSQELLARIGAVLRRRHGHSGGHVLDVHGVRLDEERQLAFVGDGPEIQLTATEFRLLRYLMLHPNRVLSKSQLAEHVYDFDSDKDSNVIEVYVNRLRGKIGRERIVTRRGQGYIYGGEP